MIFRKELGPTNVATMVERRSRYTVLFRNNDRRSRPLMARLIEVLSPLPQHARQSLTFDRGLEFVSWRELEAGMGAKAWFCDPQAPWQKGSVENMNRRVRRYLPSDTVLLALADRDMRSISDRLNATPRKCLGFRTPAEAFRDGLLEEGRPMR
ncbi:IS30 family transposase [Rubellimicrobium aerolatum]|nr:IS30 family transposase [Rubellimicrobium aerolatum]